MEAARHGYRIFYIFSPGASGGGGGEDLTIAPGSGASKKNV